MTRTRVVLILVSYILYAECVRVYEDEASDISGNLNATGPVLYQAENRTQVGMMPNRTEMMNMKEVSPPSNVMGQLNMTKSNTEEINLVPDGNTMRSSNNNTIQIATRIKENSSTKARETYRHRGQSHQQAGFNPTTEIQKPFISSPQVIVTKMGQQGQVSEVDSFQPMQEPQTSYSQAQPRQRFHSTEPIQIKSQLKEQQTEYNLLRQYIHREPQHYVQSEPQHYVQSEPQPYVQSEPQHYFQSQPPPSFQKEPQHFSYTQKETVPTVEQNLITWPESSNHQHKQLLSNEDWTTEQPETPTHKYFHPQDEYKGPKPPSNTAITILDDSHPPSTPNHPYPYELFSRHPNSYFSSSDFQQYPPASSQFGQHEHPRDFEKYEIITTSSPPDYQFSTPPAELHFDHHQHHETKVARPPKHHLPWHKIVKVLSAIIPFGLLVSALTPNVVLINPNATNTKSPLPMNLYSFLTGRQRSVDPARIFNEKLMGIVHDLKLNEQNPESRCVQQALCQVISSNLTESLTGDEYVNFQNRVCRNRVDNESLDC